MTPLNLSICDNGGIGLFAGGTNIFQMMHAGMGLATATRDALLSGLIAHLTQSPRGLSHAAVVLPRRYWTDPNMPEISQSTEYLNLSGPQLTTLHPWLDQEYGTKGGHAWIATLLPEFTPDWDAIVAYQKSQYALRNDPKNPACYCVPRLFADAAALSILFKILPGEAAIMLASTKDPNAVVCSQYVFRSMQAGGLDKLCSAAKVSYLPRVVPSPGGDECSPQDWYAMVGLYQKIYQIL